METLSLNKILALLLEAILFTMPLVATIYNLRPQILTLKALDQSAFLCNMTIVFILLSDIYALAPDKQHSECCCFFCFCLFFGGAVGRHFITIAKHLLCGRKESQIVGPFGFTQPEVLTEKL